MEKAPEAFRTISEVAELLDLPQHVLRFWETRFSQLKPLKRGGGRRFYRPADVDFLKAVQYLLYEKGYTIKGVQRLLKENGIAFLTALGNSDAGRAEAMMQEKQKGELEELFPDDIVPEQKEAQGGHSGFFGFFRSEDDRAGQSGSAAGGGEKDKNALLQQALMELIECKRLLDRARQN